ncbi:MAG: CHC2 zinc finger domain-containing protein, partial [Actinomycetota bacterium]|nr:CHC2 zinc finger domain-containing protein [Actinomycetota bacterium]
MSTHADPGYPRSRRSLPAGHPPRGGILDHVIRAVRDAAEITEVVGGYTTLRQVGQEYAGACPYPDHQDKTPSFYVNPSKGLYVCRGACGRGGDAIKLVRDLEGLEFVDAVERLADRYGIALERGDEDEGARQLREARRARERTTRGLNEFAARFYERLLWRDAGEDARRYLVEERALSQETLERFGVGFASASGRALIDAATSPDGPVARKRGRAASRKDLDEAGLLDRGGRERFSGRVVFPVRDERGRAAGFGARVMPGAESRAKYLNSPESEIFDKGNLLYGLDVALPNIRRERRAILVEGYTDVLALHQAGVGTAVAAMGT